MPCRWLGQVQPRSQGLFPGLGAGREKAFSRPAPKPVKSPWERGCARSMPLAKQEAEEESLGHRAGRSNCDRDLVSFPQVYSV